MGPNSVLGYTQLISKTPQLPTSILEVYCCFKSCFAMHLVAATLKVDAVRIVAQVAASRSCHKEAGSRNLTEII